MKILVIGSGGREHTIVWKLTQSPRVEKIFCAPGNAGISELAELVDISADNIPDLLTFARDHKIDLTLVGPEAPLVAGIVDEFQKAGLKIWGPSRLAAQMEGSKLFSKNLMKKYGIPTADFGVFDNINQAREFLINKKYPLVVKADGLAAGKGVIICPDRAAAGAALEEILEKKTFGAAGRQVVIEEFLEGEEVSLLAFCDGKTILPMVSAQDHKRIFDNDRGPNTGGMGAYSPASVLSPEMAEVVYEKILKPTLSGLKNEGIKYVGVLYAGLMMTAAGPQVLEYNARFGDPETQVILPRLKTDLLEIIEASLEQRLDKIKLNWDDRAAVCLVMAADGYPGNYKKGDVISGLEDVQKMSDVVVFHAGTRSENGRTVTAGGRVLGVTALGNGIEETIKKAYAAAAGINFSGVQYRQDIGQKALKRK